MNGSRHRLRTRVAIVAVALATCAVSAAPAAHAGELKLRTCWRGLPVAEPVVPHNWDIDDSTDWKVNALCPEGFTFDTSSPTTYGDARANYYGGGYGLKRVRFTVEGGGSPGVTYSVVGCDTCDLQAQLDARASTATPTSVDLALESGGLPVGSLTIRVRCAVGIGCAGADPLKAYDFEFTAVDDDPPSDLTRISSSVVSGPFYRQVGLSIQPGVIDYASGVSRFDAWIDGVEVWRSFGCELLPTFFVSSPPCADAELGGSMDVSTLRDGWHTLRTSAIDAAGNVMPELARTFAIDGTPPDPPADIMFPAFHDGWTWRTAIDTSWTNRGERTEEGQSGLVLVGYDLVPLGGQTMDPPPVEKPGLDIRLIRALPLPEDGRWELRMWTEDRVTNRSAIARVKVGRDVDAPKAPVLDPNPWLNRGMLIDGYEQHWHEQPDDPDLESGICGYSAGIDGSPGTEPLGPPTLGVGSRSLPVPANLTAGVHFAHVAAVSCAGLASPAAHAQLRVDDLDPVVDAIGESGDGWSNGGSMVKIVASDAHSGVESIEYGIEDSPPVVVSSDVAELHFADGSRKLTFSAVDRAGNRAPETTVSVKVDTTPPVVSYVPPVTDDLSAIRARIADPVSGLATATVSYTRIDDPGDIRHALPTTIAHNGDHSIAEARLPHEQLSDGTYAVYVESVDRAGNGSTTELSSAGSDPLRIRLPLRERTAVAAALATVERRCVTVRRGRCGRGGVCPKRKRKGCVTKTVVDRDGAKPRLIVDYGSSTALVGELRDSRGAPVRGATVRMTASAPGGFRGGTGSAVTGLDGEFEFRLPRGPSRTLSVRFDGDKAHAASSRAAELAVRGGIVLSADRRTASAGDFVNFSGRLRSGGDAVPSRGKLVQLEVKAGGRWLPAKGWTRSDQRGRFEIEEIAVTKSSGKLLFRAVTPAESGWPYEDGVSQTVGIRLHR